MDNKVFYYILLNNKAVGVQVSMKGKIMLAFFSLFAATSFLIPVPLFPGNWFCMLIGKGVKDYARILSAVFNGAFYGAILWLVFIGASRKITQ